MEAECFGGEESSNANANAHQQPSSSWKRERTRNAFMLVYDRVMPQQEQHEPTAGGKDDSRTSPLPPASSLPSSPGGSPSSSPASPPPPPPPLSVAPDAAATDNDATEALPRASGGTPVLARGDVSPDTNVHGREGASAVRGRRRRKRFRAKVPAVFMRQIHQENLEFWRCGLCVACLILIF